MRSKWTSESSCDFCRKPISGKLYDAKTKDGPWATMCEKCWKKHGTGKLGPGEGQEYVKMKGEFICSRGDI